MDVVTTRVAPLRHRAVSRVDSAERWVETGIVIGLHRHDDDSWFVPSFSSGHIVVTPCVDVSPTCACAISCSLPSHHLHDVSTRLPRCFVKLRRWKMACLFFVDASDGRSLFEITLSFHLLKTQ